MQDSTFSSSFIHYAVNLTTSWCRWLSCVRVYTQTHLSNSLTGNHDAKLSLYTLIFISYLEHQNDKWFKIGDIISFIVPKTWLVFLCQFSLSQSSARPNLSCSRPTSCPWWTNSKRSVWPCRSFRYIQLCHSCGCGSHKVLTMTSHVTVTFMVDFKVFGSIDSWKMTVSCWSVEHTP